MGTVVNANSSSPIAQAYATGNGEVRLPINEQEKKLLAYQGSNINKVRFYHPSSDVLLAEGVIIRIEATLNNKNRLFYCVGEIPKAFIREDNLYDSTLQRSQFLIAKIEGQIIKSVFTIPNAALRNNEYVYTVNEYNRLIQKKVNVIHKNKESVIISGGLNAVEKIVISPIAYFVENMAVNPISK